MLRQETVFIEAQISDKFEEDKGYYYVIKYVEANETIRVEEKIRVEEEIWNKYDVGGTFVYKKTIWRIG